MSIASIFQLALAVCFVVAVVMAAVRGEYKSSGAWFYTAYAIAALLLVLGH